MRVPLIQKSIEHYARVIELGEKLKSTRRSPPAGVISGDFVDSSLANQWFVSTLNLLARTLSEKSEHYEAMKRLYVAYPEWSEVDRAFGILLAAKSDIENDAFFEAQSLITAEVFDDLLEQADALLGAKYYAPAAVVIGCVLEDGLRRLCMREKLPTTEKMKLDSMNSCLAKAGIYNKLTQKKITALADIRNSAAHGKWEEFECEDVDDMLRWVQNFIEKYFS